VRWLVDTSAWARRALPHVAEQLAAILDEDPDSEFVLSPAVLLELMRGPQGAEVGEARRELEGTMQVLAADGATFELAADAMERLAEIAAEAHRLPVSDLITAALAHQHGCGVVHLDGDFTLLAEQGGLAFEARGLELPAPDGEAGSSAGPSPAVRQRTLKKELSQLLHQMSFADAEAFLEGAVEQARERAALAPGKLDGG
jgi:predicted nucleic acid-binding protein